MPHLVAPALVPPHTKALTGTRTLMWLAGLLAGLDDEQRGRLHSAIPVLRRLVTNPYMNLP